MDATDWPPRFTISTPDAIRMSIRFAACHPSRAEEAVTAADEHITEALAIAYRAGSRWMQEQATEKCEEGMGPVGMKHAAAVRALPTEPSDG